MNGVIARTLPIVCDIFGASATSLVPRSVRLSSSRSDLRSDELLKIFLMLSALKHRAVLHLLSQLAGLQIGALDRSKLGLQRK